VTRFPFGFLQKARRIALKSEALVYPSVESNSELSEIFPGIDAASRAITRGGAKICTPCANTSHRQRQPRALKASARAGSLMVREFAREDDFRVLLVLDPHPGELSANSKTLPRRTLRTCRHHLRRNCLDFTNAMASYNFAAPESKPALLPPKKHFAICASSSRTAATYRSPGCLAAGSRSFARSVQSNRHQPSSWHNSNELCTPLT